MGPCAHPSLQGGVVGVMQGAESPAKPAAPALHWSVDGTPQDCCRNKFCGAAPGTASSRPKAQLAARARRKQENVLLWGPGVMSGGGSSRTGWVFCMKGACSARPSSVLECWLLPGKAALEGWQGIVTADLQTLRVSPPEWCL